MGNFPYQKSPNLIPQATKRHVVNFSRLSLHPTFVAAIVAVDGCTSYCQPALGGKWDATFSGQIVWCHWQKTGYGYRQGQQAAGPFPTSGLWRSSRVPRKGKQRLRPHASHIPQSARDLQVDSFSSIPFKWMPESLPSRSPPAIPYKTARCDSIELGAKGCCGDPSRVPALPCSSTTSARLFGATEPAPEGRPSAGPSAIRRRALGACSLFSPSRPDPSCPKPLFLLDFCLCPSFLGLLVLCSSPSVAARRTIRESRSGSETMTLFPRPFRPVFDASWPPR